MIAIASQRTRDQQTDWRLCESYRRSFCMIHEVPTSNGAALSSDGSKAFLNDHSSHRDFGTGVRVAAFPSADSRCEHQLFVEDGSLLKKLDLPSTAWVTLS